MRVHHPLQQGLRLIKCFVVIVLHIIVRVHHPLQQGLRLSPTWRTLFQCVRVHHPLQQGLRLIGFLLHI